MKLPIPSATWVAPLVISGLFYGLLIAGAAASAAEPATAKPDPAKGAAIAGTVCVACHAIDGTRGAIAANPILQGQHAEYLVKQLSEFKSGKRDSPIMKGMAAMLSPQDVLDVAAFFAAKPAVPGAASDEDALALGEKIYRGGVLERKVPACAGCHSPNGAGLPSQYPRVAGQQAEYTQAQLLAFRDGTRGNGPAMAAVAAKLSDKEIKALADYMQGLH